MRTKDADEDTLLASVPGLTCEKLLRRPVLVSLDCYNKLPHTCGRLVGGLQFWKLESKDQDPSRSGIWRRLSSGFSDKHFY